MPSTALVWFRRDLRVHDHPALAAAHREAGRVVPVFVLDPRLLDAGRFPSANRAWFLLASLRELRAALRDRGADLVVRPGRPERVLPALAREVGADVVHFASDVSPFAMARVRAAPPPVRARRAARAGLSAGDRRGRDPGGPGARGGGAAPARRGRRARAPEPLARRRDRALRRSPRPARGRHVAALALPALR